MDTNPFSALLKSRKFWLAVLDLAALIFTTYFKLPADVWASVNAVLLVLIGTIAVEDFAAKFRGLK